MDKPLYIIVAGVNGSGKSTLYSVQPGLFKNTNRLNADEILKNNGWDWHNELDNLKAMKIEGKKLHQFLNEHKSLHVETTLAGKGNSQSKLIDRAHENGFRVILLYVSLNNSEIAIKRVHHRVTLGGHGVDNDLIKKRYQQSLENLPKIINKVDEAFIFDNSEDVLKLIYNRKDKNILFNNLSKYKMIKI